MVTSPAKVTAHTSAGGALKLAVGLELTVDFLDGTDREDVAVCGKVQAHPSRRSHFEELYDSGNGERYVLKVRILGPKTFCGTTPVEAPHAFFAFRFAVMVISLVQVLPDAGLSRPVEPV